MPSLHRLGSRAICWFAPFAALCGCSSLPISARVARAEVTVANTLRLNAPLAAQQCYAQSAYTYYEERLGLGPKGSEAQDEAYNAWYTHALATDTTPWAEYCGKVGHTGTAYHNGVLALRGYAQAVLAIAEREPFDGSGFQRMADGAATAAAALGAADPIGRAAVAVGGALSELSKIAEQHIRAQNLRALVVDAAPIVRRLIVGLSSYLDALEGQRRVAAHHRGIVLRAASAARSESGRFTAPADAAIAFDLAAQGESRIHRSERRLGRDHGILAKTLATHDALARVPWTEHAPDALLAAIGELEAELTSAADAPPEE